jgi:hypothetical protein
LNVAQDFVHDACQRRRGIDDDGVHGLPRFEITPIGQLSITVDDVIAAPLQLATDRSFPGAGNAIDKIISL